MATTCVMAEPSALVAESTIYLTEALEAGELSPSQYVEKRAEMIGEGTLIDFVLLSTAHSILALFLRMFHHSSKHLG